MNYLDSKITNIKSEINILSDNIQLISEDQLEHMRYLAEQLIDICWYVEHDVVEYRGSPK